MAEQPRACMIRLVSAHSREHHETTGGGDTFCRAWFVSRLANYNHMYTFMHNTNSRELSDKIFTGPPATPRRPHRVVASGAKARALLVWGQA